VRVIPLLRVIPLTIKRRKQRENKTKKKYTFYKKEKTLKRRIDIKKEDQNN
jgi:hypothetical protein